MTIRTKIKSWLSGLYVRFKGRPGALRYAVRTAERKHRVSGKRYRVFFIENRYQVLNRVDIQRKKHQGAWGWHVNATGLEPFCFYDTSDTASARLVREKN